MKLLNRKPGRHAKIWLGVLPFVLLVVGYGVASHVRRLENPAAKIQPSLEALAAAFHRMAFVPNPRTGDVLLWVDTADSLMRLGLGLGVSTLLALSLGLLIGALPYARLDCRRSSPSSHWSRRLPSCRFYSSSSASGSSPVMLIVVGTAPIMIRSTSQAVLDIPRELVIKAQTLGASTWQITIACFCRRSCRS